MILMSTRSNGLPTQIPMPASVKSRVASTSSLPTTQIGMHSVAPYGVNTSTPSFSQLRIRCSVSGKAGAPAEMTRLSVGAFLPRATASRETVLSSAGLANILVTANSLITAYTMSGSTLAGNRASMSGITAVMPRAGSNSENGGNVGRSISPSCM